MEKLMEGIKAVKTINGEVMKYEAKATEGYGKRDEAILALTNGDITEAEFEKIVKKLIDPVIYEGVANKFNFKAKIEKKKLEKRGKMKFNDVVDVIRRDRKRMQIDGKIKNARDMYLDNEVIFKDITGMTIAEYVKLELNEVERFVVDNVLSIPNGLEMNQEAMGATGARVIKKGESAKMKVKGI